MSSIFANAFANMVTGAIPVDPANESRADEISPEQLMDKLNPPYAECPYCHAELTTDPVLDNNGEFLAWTPVPNPCKNPKCRELEDKRRDKLRKERDAFARRQAMIADDMCMDDLIGGNGFSAGDYGTMRFECFDSEAIDQQRALRVCTKYVDEFSAHLGRNGGDGAGLYLHGSYGRGKTHLVMAIGTALREQMYGGIVYRSGSWLFSDIKATYSNQNTSERDVISVFSSCNLLILDDLEKSTPNEWAMARLYDILDTRYRKKQPVIMASNLSLSQMTEFMASGMGDDRGRAGAILDRLTERMRTIMVMGESYRTPAERNRLR